METHKAMSLHKTTKIILGVSMSWVGSHYFIIIFIRSEHDPIEFGSKNLDPYPTRRVTDRPDPTYIK
jgi:hypothetical protein